MSDIGSITSGMYSSQLMGQLVSNTVALRSAVKSEQAMAQAIAEDSKAAYQAGTGGTDNKSGGISVYA